MQEDIKIWRYMATKSVEMSIIFIMSSASLLSLFPIFGLQNSIKIFLEYLEV